MPAEPMPARSSWSTWVQGASTRSVPDDDEDTETRPVDADDLEAKLEWPSTDAPAAVMRRSEATTATAGEPARPSASGLLPGLVARVGSVERLVASMGDRIDAASERIDAASEAAAAASLDLADRLDRLNHAVDELSRALASDVVAANDELSSRAVDHVVAAIADRIDRASAAATAGTAAVSHRLDELARAVDEVGQRPTPDAPAPTEQLTVPLDRLLEDSTAILEQLTAMRRRLPVRPKTDERAQLLERVTAEVQAAVAAEFDRIGHEIAERTVASLLNTFDVEVVPSPGPDESTVEGPAGGKRRRSGDRASRRSR